MALPAQAPNEGEQAYRKMEKAFLDAKAVECAFEIKVEDAQVSTVKGDLALGEGSKVRLAVKGDSAGKEFKSAIISDGKRMVAVGGPTQEEPKESPAWIGEALRGTTARCGITGVVLIFLVAPAGEDKEFKLDDRLKVADFKLGKAEKVDGKEAQVIEYNCTLKGQDEPMKMKVWVDAKTNLPLKREIKSKPAGQDVTVTETYSKITLDGKIDAKTFDLPK
jgi:outer membrane lipoprotein-sorting protein